MSVLQYEMVEQARSIKKLADMGKVGGEKENTVYPKGGEEYLNSVRGEGGLRPVYILFESPNSKKEIKNLRSVPENLKISENIQHCPHNQNWRQKLLKFRALDSDDRQSEALSVTNPKELKYLSA